MGLMKTTKGWIDRRGGPEGFTLLELIISLSILSIIVVLVFGALRVGVRAWERGEEHTENLQRIRGVLSLMQRQIASITAQNVMENGTKPFYFKGDESSMEFLTYCPAIPEKSPGMARVKYFVSENGKDAVSLLFREAAFLIPEEAKKDWNENPHELISGFQRIEFAYTMGQVYDNPVEWIGKWDAEIRNDFPAAVRIRIRDREGSNSTSLIVRLEHKEAVP